MTYRDGVLLPEPLAYFLTWTTYGTWLPGDERGWVKRRQGHQLPDARRARKAKVRMKEGRCVLSVRERAVVEQTIRDHCRIRGWHLHAVACRSNHVHVVVAANTHPDMVQRQFKTVATTRLKKLQREGRSEQSRPIRTRWWTERASKRYVNDEASLDLAIRYVLEAQDSPRYEH